MVKVDILGGDWTECEDCGDSFGTHFAVEMGIVQTALCFSCIVTYLKQVTDWDDD